MKRIVGISTYEKLLPLELIKSFKYKNVEESVKVIEGLDLHMDVLDGPVLSLIGQIYREVAPMLKGVLDQRVTDREFMKARTIECNTYNSQQQSLDLGTRRTVIGQKDASNRVVIGFNDPRDETVSSSWTLDIPPDWQGDQITLFGPPEDAKMAVNAMNCLDRVLPGEAALVSELVSRWSSQGGSVKWGADSEDSLTPLGPQLLDSIAHLKQCYDKSLTTVDPRSNKQYSISPHSRVRPIKRFPGLHMPDAHVLVDDQPVPMHLLDAVLHLYHNRLHPEAWAFYIPKLESEEEARYIDAMLTVAERRIREYQEAAGETPVLLSPGQGDSSNPGSGSNSKVFVIFENSRAMFRRHEIMHALRHRFLGGSLGWHDYLASAGYIFREDAHYYMPIKSDPGIVRVNMNLSHQAMGDVKTRGGCPIGGMYGVLPNPGDEDSYRVAIKGFIKDVVIQCRRGLQGFWIAHPDFVRIGIAIVQAYREGEGVLQALIGVLLSRDQDREDVTRFIQSPVVGMPESDPRYPLALLAADLPESERVQSVPGREAEVRYNIFQSLQYLASWLSGTGCVKLPTRIEGVREGVMDDAATMQRSACEVHHQVRHGKISRERVLQLIEEVYTGITLQTAIAGQEIKIPYLNYEKWYSVSKYVVRRVMTDEEPPEFFTELALPFVYKDIREQSDPLSYLQQLIPHKYI